MPEDDQRATRNLFIGNLDHNVSEVELRRAFEKYGIIEEVVIKRPARGQGGAYAFLKFQNLDMAHRAKVAMSGRVVGRNPIKIGYGKANPTTRLWVGGLGPSGRGRGILCDGRERLLMLFLLICLLFISQI
uniref:RRM domain-containing protein n=1 Tax=Anas zonorhyncha TaxID=75864 RepID=A0A8B9VBR2_9AVES